MMIWAGSSVAERVPVKHQRVGSSPIQPSLILVDCPAGVMDGMAGFEPVGRGSIPRRGTY